jgi:hypothetical protein
MSTFLDSLSAILREQRTHRRRHVRVLLHREPIMHAGAGHARGSPLSALAADSAQEPTVAVNIGAVGTSVPRASAIPTHGWPTKW